MNDYEELSVIEEIRYFYLEIVSLMIETALVAHEHVSVIFIAYVLFLQDLMHTHLFF